MRILRSGWVGLSLLAALAVAPPVRATEVEGATEEQVEDASLEERLRALEEEVAIQGRQLDVKKEEDQKDKDRSGVVTLDKDGFQLRSRDQKTYRFRLRGYVHSDGRFFLEGDDQANDTFFLRRARPIFEGTLFEIVDFRIMPDFGGQGTGAATATIQDAWVNFRPWSWAQLQSGKFKAPFGLERLQSATAITFIERGFPTELIPNRDVGVQLHGDIREGLVQYQLAVMNGVLDGGSADADTNDGKDIVARIFLHPFQETAIEPLQGLGLGMAASYGNQDGVNAATAQYRNSGRQVFFSYAANVQEQDEHTRLGPQAYWYWGPLGVMGEWVRSSTSLRQGTTEISPDHEAWQVSASWVLTGENASYKGVVPRSPFHPASADTGAGAWEIAGRFSRFDADGRVFDKGFADPAVSVDEAIMWTVGVNWYINPFLKFSVNYDDTHYRGGRASAGHNRTRDNVLLSRIQVAF